MIFFAKNNNKSDVELVETPITRFSKAKFHGGVSTGSTTAPLKTISFFYKKAILSLSVLQKWRNRAILVVKTQNKSLK